MRSWAVHDSLDGEGNNKCAQTERQTIETFLAHARDGDNGLEILA